MHLLKVLQEVYVADDFKGRFTGEVGGCLERRERKCGHGELREPVVEAIVNVKGAQVNGEGHPESRAAAALPPDFDRVSSNARRITVRHPLFLSGQKHQHLQVRWGCMCVTGLQPLQASGQCRQIVEEMESENDIAEEEEAMWAEEMSVGEEISEDTLEEEDVGRRHVG